MVDAIRDVGVLDVGDQAHRKRHPCRRFRKLGGGGIPKRDARGKRGGRASAPKPGLGRAGVAIAAIRTATAAGGSARCTTVAAVLAAAVASRGTAAVASAAGGAVAPTALRLTQAPAPVAHEKLGRGALAAPYRVLQAELVAARDERLVVFPPVTPRGLADTVDDVRDAALRVAGQVLLGATHRVKAVRLT